MPILRTSSAETREGLQGQRAAASRVLGDHRVAGVDREVDDHLLELAGIGAHRAEAAAVLDLELDPLAEQPVEQMRDLGDDVGELEHLRAQASAGARKRATGG